MSKNIVDTLTGAFVLVVAISFAYIFITKGTNVKSRTDTYVLKAKFENIEGVEPGSVVKIGGVNVGIVLSKELDPQTYFAILSIALDKKVKLPDDSTAKISSTGLLGEKFLSIIPGGDEKMLAENDEIKYTQSSVNLETLIGKLIFSKENAPAK